MKGLINFFRGEEILSIDQNLKKGSRDITIFDISSSCKIPVKQSKVQQAK